MSALPAAPIPEENVDDGAGDLTSRADSAESRLASCAVAVAYANWQKEGRVKKYSQYPQQPKLLLHCNIPALGPMQ